MKRSATISDCGQYRYMLHRSWGLDPRILLFVMLNPSKGDAKIDDHTIRKCIGFGKRLGYDRICIVNLYAWRATNPGDLGNVVDPVGPLNDGYIDAAARGCNRMIVAWGANKFGDEKRVGEFLKMGRMASWPAMECLGTAKEGAPRHPLMLSYETPLELW